MITLEQKARVEAIIHIKTFNWSKLSTQQLLDILKIIQAEEQ